MYFLNWPLNTKHISDLIHSEFYPNHHIQIQFYINHNFSKNYSISPVSSSYVPLAILRFLLELA